MDRAALTEAAMQGPKVVKYICEDVDRHGNVRIYFRRKGVKARINETLWSDGFWVKYHELLRLSKAGELQRGAQPGGVGERLVTKAQSKNSSTKLQPLLKAAEVAAILRCSDQAVEEMPLPFLERGQERLYDPADVQRFIEQGKRYPASVPVSCT